MKAEDIKTISVIGSGLMGSGIAQVFASKNYNVYLYNRPHPDDAKGEFLAKRLEGIRSILTTMAQRGLGSESEIDSIMGRIKPTTSLDEATSDVQFIIENVAEDLELKQKVFQDLDQRCPLETILATNTSVMSPTDVAAKSRHRERILATHWWNPAYMIPLVEVVKGKDTSDEVLDTTYNLMKNAGKHPIKVLKDVPGFVCNRLQHALAREAVSIVERGIADAATVDDAIKKGFGIRLPALGPLEGTDMVGLDMLLAIQNYVLKHLEDSHDASPLLKEKVEKGELGIKTGRGFYTWTAEKAQQRRKEFLDYLFDWALREKGKTT